jgi:hypothetical protein
LDLAGVAHRLGLPPLGNLRFVLDRDHLLSVVHPKLGVPVICACSWREPNARSGRDRMVRPA